MTSTRPPEQRRNPHYAYGDCSHPGCDRKDTRIVRGLCTPHYDRLRKYGDPSLGMPLNGSAQKFLTDVVMKHIGDECLIWPFAKSGVGYGQVVIDGKKVNVHRQVCTELHGQPPTSRHEAAHSCGNGHLGCVSPRHLSWKTASENQMDRAIHGTSNRGERQWNAKLTSEDVRRIRLMFSPNRTDTDIAELFGVSSSAIRAIRIRASWGWLDAPEQEIAA